MYNTYPKYCEKCRLVTKHELHPSLQEICLLCEVREDMKKLDSKKQNRNGKNN
jgi:hypothetical protein